MSFVLSDRLCITYARKNRTQMTLMVQISTDLFVLLVWEWCSSCCTFYLFLCAEQELHTSQEKSIFNCQLFIVN